MPALIPSTFAIGGMGLLLVGVLLATDGLRVASDRLLRWGLPRLGARRWRAGLLGAVAGLAPPSRLQPTTAVGLASSGLLGTGSALAAGIGASFATVATVWVSGFAALRPALFYVALLALGASALAYQIVPRPSVRGWTRVLAGWSVLAIGAHLCARGLADWEALPRARPSVGYLGESLVACGAGTALGAALGAGCVTALVACAGVGGVLAPSTACAVILGAHAAAATGAWLVLPDERGTGKRVAAGVAASHMLQSIVGLLALAFASSSLPSAGAGSAGAVLGISLIVGGAWLVGTLLLFALHDQVVAALEEWVDAEGGAAVRSLVLPELARAAASGRAARCSACLRRLARNVLADGRTPDHSEQDREEVHALAHEIDAIHSGGPDALARARDSEVCPAGTWALRALADDLLLAQRERAAQDALLAGTVGPSLQQVQGALLSIVEGALAPGAAHRAGSLARELHAMERHLVELERWTVWGAGHAIGPELALALAWRLARLRTLGRTAVQLAESRIEPAHVESEWRRLQEWLSSRAPRRRAA